MERSKKRESPKRKLRETAEGEPSSEKESAEREESYVAEVPGPSTSSSRRTYAYTARIDESDESHPQTSKRLIITLPQPASPPTSPTTSPTPPTYHPAIGPIIIGLPPPLPYRSPVTQFRPERYSRHMYPLPQPRLYPGLAEIAADFVEIEGGDFAETEGGDFAETEGGDFAETEGGDFAETEGGDFAETEGGDFEEAEGGDFEEAEGGDYAEAEGGDYAEAEGGDYAEAEGGDYAEAEGGDYAEAEGGDYAEAEGGDYAEAEGGDYAETGGDFAETEFSYQGPTTKLPSTAQVESDDDFMEIDLDPGAASSIPMLPAGLKPSKGSCRIVDVIAGKIPPKTPKKLKKYRKEPTHVQLEYHSKQPGAGPSSEYPTVSTDVDEPSTSRHPPHPSRRIGAYLGWYLGEWAKGKKKWKKFGKNRVSILETPETESHPSEHIEPEVEATEGTSKGHTKRPVTMKIPEHDYVNVPHFIEDKEIVIRKSKSRLKKLFSKIKKARDKRKKAKSTSEERYKLVPHRRSKSEEPPYILFEDESSPEQGPSPSHVESQEAASVPPLETVTEHSTPSSTSKSSSAPSFGATQNLEDNISLLKRVIGAEDLSEYEEYIESAQGSPEPPVQSVSYTDKNLYVSILGDKVAKKAIATYEDLVSENPPTTYERQEIPSTSTSHITQRPGILPPGVDPSAFLESEAQGSPTFSSPVLTRPIDPRSESLIDALMETDEVIEFSDSDQPQFPHFVEATSFTTIQRPPKLGTGEKPSSFESEGSDISIGSPSGLSPSDTTTMLVESEGSDASMSSTGKAPTLRRQFQKLASIDSEDESEISTESPSHVPHAQGVPSRLHREGSTSSDSRAQSDSETSYKRKAPPGKPISPESKIKMSRQSSSESQPEESGEQSETSLTSDPSQYSETALLIPKTKTKSDKKSSPEGSKTPHVSVTQHEEMEIEPSSSPEFFPESSEISSLIPKTETKSGKTSSPEGSTTPHVSVTEHEEMEIEPSSLPGDFPESSDTSSLIPKTKTKSGKKSSPEGSKAPHVSVTQHEEMEIEPTSPEDFPESSDTSLLIPKTKTKSGKKSSPKGSKTPHVSVTQHEEMEIEPSSSPEDFPESSDTSLLIPKTKTKSGKKSSPKGSKTPHVSVTQHEEMEIEPSSSPEDFPESSDTSLLIPKTKTKSGKKSSPKGSKTPHVSVTQHEKMEIEPSPPSPGMTQPQDITGYEAEFEEIISPVASPESSTTMTESGKQHIESKPGSSSKSKKSKFSPQSITEKIKTVLGKSSKSKAKDTKAKDESLVVPSAPQSESLSPDVSGYSSSVEREQIPPSVPVVPPEVQDPFSYRSKFAYSSPKEDLPSEYIPSESLGTSASVDERSAALVESQTGYRSPQSTSQDVPSASESTSEAAPSTSESKSLDVPSTSESQRAKTPPKGSLKTFLGISPKSPTEKEEDPSTKKKSFMEDVKGKLSKKDKGKTDKDKKDKDKKDKDKKRKDKK